MKDLDTLPDNLPIPVDDGACDHLWDAYLPSIGLSTMQVTQIPFAQTVGIQRDAEGRLTLPAADALHNHLGTLHASAQFALAETASGDHLQCLFPELAGHVVPLLRSAEVRFRRPASGSVHAVGSVADAARERFIAQLRRKGRASISVEVEVRDADGAVTCGGSYDWYVQTL